jgi:hypothetical protein
MDISKLPKLSDSKAQEAPAAPDQPVAPAPVPTPQYPAGNIGGDIWISLIVGILLCLLGKTFASFCMAKIMHQPYHTTFFWDSDGPGGKAGEEISYFNLPGFTAWSDMGLFIFGLVLLFEAASKTLLVLRPGKIARAALMFAIILTIAGVGLNLIACVKMLGGSIIPTLSALAVAIGGWILFDEINTLKRTQVISDPESI